MANNPVSLMVDGGDRKIFVNGRTLVRFARFALACFCLSSAGLTAFAQNTNPGALNVLTQNQSRPRNPEVSDSRLFKGKARFETLHGPISGIRSRSAKTIANGNKGTMPFWQGNFPLFGATFPFRMIGTDPSKGSASTTVSVQIIPLQLSFADGTQTSASQIACGDTQTVASRIIGSPLFQKTPFTIGGTFVGNTQYEDAFQRANFWNFVSTTSPNYHVLLSPQLNATVALTPDPALASDLPLSCAQDGFSEIGFADIGDLEVQIEGLIASMHIPGNVLPIFVMYNTFMTQDGGCCILGLHNVTLSANAQTYVIASYSDPNIFNVPIEDIHALSHELGEWMDDPFGRNFIPAWGNVGQEGGCSNLLEVGDPVTGIAGPITLNGFTYHPEDLVFLPWFSKQTPSTSVNGQFTFLNSFAAPQAVCQP